MKNNIKEMKIILKGKIDNFPTRRRKEAELLEGLLNKK